MHLPRFEHLLPASLEDVVRLLDEYGPRARLVAGGTDLFPRMKYGLEHPDAVIGLKGIPVEDPTLDKDGKLCLDAMMPLADLARSKMVLEGAPLLAEAALSVGSNEIRHMGTLGGNICLENRCTYYNQSHTFQFVEPCYKRDGDLCYHTPGGKKCLAVFSADTVPALISLDAMVSIAGSGGTRQLPLKEFYTGDAVNPRLISNGEVVKGVIIPVKHEKRGHAFLKFSIRGGMEFAALNVAVIMDMEDDAKTCHGARITVGALSAAPVRMLKAEEAMSGRGLSADLFEETARGVSSEAHPYPHHGYSAGYLRECLRVQTRRALSTASERI